jgi:cyanuric acid amidohydrolase
METPNDVAAVRALFDDGRVDPASVVALVGKTEGPGLGHDPGREAADHALRELLGAQDVCVVLSGGTPGVLTPHVAVVSRRWTQAAGPVVGGRLTVGRARSGPIRPEDVGRRAQVDAVAGAVRAALADAGIADPADVHAVLVKAPSLGPDALGEARSRGRDTVTTDLSIGPDGAMCWSNDASALGVAVALGEVPSDAVRDDVIRRDWDLFSAVAMTSSGGEKTHAEVLVLGNSAAAGGSLRIGHHPMADLLDTAAVPAAVRAAAGSAAGSGSAEVVYVLAKMIVPGGARLRGRRLTMHDDPLAYHVAKAMGGYLVAATTGHTMAFVSGGEHNSHQGPPDGNPVAAIVRLPEGEGQG